MDLRNIERSQLRRELPGFRISGQRRAGSNRFARSLCLVCSQQADNRSAMSVGGQGKKAVPKQSRGVSATAISKLPRSASFRNAQALDTSQTTDASLAGAGRSLNSEKTIVRAVRMAELSANYHKAFPFLPEEFLSKVNGLHKPVGLVVTSAYVLETACQLTGAGSGFMVLPAFVGGVVGALYAALNRMGMKRLWRAPDSPLKVVITGGSKGIGKALSREFLRSGDSVVITSRSPAGVRHAVAALREEVGPEVRVYGIECDVASEASVARLADFAQSKLGNVDVWINNAGYSGSFKAFVDLTSQQLGQIVDTNLKGSLLCTKAAMKLMAGQPQGGHVFNTDGAGADGMATPMYAAYGATKAGIAHLMASLASEAMLLANPVGIHTLSPGMVLTELLLEGATEQNKAVFNILCEQPETVAAFLVPRVRTVVARRQPSSYIKYLTLTRALSRFVSAPLRTNRFFDAQGNRLYEPERQRIMGDKSRRTQRLAEKAARRSQKLALAYSLSIAFSYMLLMIDATHVLHS